MTRPLARELEVALRLAREAGAAIEEVKARSVLETREKAGDEGPVTEADLAADRLIVAGLREAFPDDRLITEETWGEVGERSETVDPGPRAWIVDPLDGTREFVGGHDDYSVMIGLLIDEEPALGVVYQPPTARLWAGVVEGGTCFVEDDGGRRAVDLRSQDAPDEVRLAVSRSHKGKIAELAAEAFGVVAIEKGSVGLKVGMIVDGEAHVYMSGSRKMKVWDTCAPVAIARAAGAMIEAVDGTPLTWVGPVAHGQGLRVLPPALVAEWRPKIDEVVTRWQQERVERAARRSPKRDEEE